MTWMTFVFLALLILIASICLAVLMMIKSVCVTKEAGAYAGGQAYAATSQAEATERIARANAYFTQVQSMEQGWQTFIENHYAVAGKNPGVDDVRAMRAAFENMYDFAHLEQQQQ